MKSLLIDFVSEINDTNKCAAKLQILFVDFPSLLIFDTLHPQSLSLMRIHKSSPLSLLFIISLVIGVSEALVMILLGQWSLTLTSVQEAVLDATLLTALSAPLLWWLALRPLEKALASEHDRTSDPSKSELMLNFAKY